MYYYSATVGSSLSSPTATKVLSQGDNKTGHIVILLYLSIFGGGGSRSSVAKTRTYLDNYD